MIFESLVVRQSSNSIHSLYTFEFELFSDSFPLMTQNPPLTDEQLVQKSIENMDFFGELVDRYEMKLKYYILRISSFSSHEADEILQEIFLKVWQNLQGYTGAVKFSSWIYRIAHNETISAYRKYTSRGGDKTVELNEEIFELAPSKINIPAEFNAKESAHMIQQVLQAMPEKYREVLIFQYFEDMSYEEISDVLKKPMGTVATLVNRAKKSFRETADRLSFQFSFHDEN